MRRRSRMKTLKILHLFSSGHLVAFLMLFLCNKICAEPGYLDFDNLPETNFTCAGKVIGGYYADLETSCQMFHVCTIGQLDEPMDIKFLCLNGTVFDQETRVCERVDEVDCSKSEKFYYLNLELYGNTMVPMPEDSEHDSSTIATISSISSTTTSTTTTTPRPTTTSKATTTQIPSTTTKPHPSYSFPTFPRHQSFSFNSSGFSFGGSGGGSQQNQGGFSTTTFSTPHHYLSSTLSPKQGGGPTGPEEGTAEGGEENEEYDYEDEYLVVTEKGGKQSFSPQQFILDQNKDKSKNTQNSPAKQAISFQQQRFQNSGPSAPSSQYSNTPYQSSPSGSNNANQNSNSKFVINNNNKNYFIGGSASTGNGGNRIFPSGAAGSASSTNRPNSFNYFGPTGQQKQERQQQERQQQERQQQQQQQSNQLPKRIPLLTLGQQQQQELQNNINFQAQQQLNFRIRGGAGFQLPSPPLHPQLAQPRPFEGYRRQSPPQIPLHLPFEGRSTRDQKDLLGFEDVAESLINTEERKDQKRSDSSGGKPSHFNSLIEATNQEATNRKNVTVKVSVDKKVEVAQSQRQEEPLVEDEDEYETDDELAVESDQPEDNEPSNNLKNYSTLKKDQQQNQQQQQQKTPVETILIPQERYKPTLPKVIITASASVSDANGKKLNYSLGNVLGQGKDLKIPPPTYDDYKEEDVILDPFFLDVPKLNAKSSSSSSSISNKKSK